MTISKHVSQFVSAVGRVFPPYADDNEAAAEWMAIMDRTLYRMSPDVLAAAADHILQSRHPKRDGKWFPTPRECLDACHHAMQVMSTAAELARREQTPLLTHDQRDQSQWAGWRYDFADRLIAETELGRTAARGGWVLALHDFIRVHNRMPKDKEIDLCKWSARRLHDLITKCEAAVEKTDAAVVGSQSPGDALAVLGALARLGRTIAERGDDMAAHVLKNGPKVWRR